MNDFRQRFFFPDTDVRGEFVRLQDALTPVLTAREYPLEIQSQLGEALVAAGLLAGTLKFDGRLALQAQGKGEMSLLLAEATHDHTVRGLAHWKEPVAQGDLPGLRTLLGEEAVMVITLKPAQGQDYQSLVPLVADDMSGCLEGYFAQSEQLPTRLWLACGNGRATGLLLQRLPDQVADAQRNAEHWQTLSTLAGTLTTEELLHLPVDTLLHRLFHETPPQLPQPAALRFACTCSRERMQSVLRSMGAEELRSLLDERGSADICCDFCRHAQHFDAAELACLIEQLAQ